MRAGHRALDSDLIPYDPSYKPDPQELMYIPIEDQTPLKHLVDSLADLPSLETMVNEPAYYRHLSFVID